MEEVQINDQITWLEATQKKKDPEVMEIMRRIQENPDSIKEYTVKDKILLRVFEKENKTRYYVPSSMRFNLVRMYHDKHCHIGADKTIEVLKTKYWFPKMTAFVRKYVGHCITCLSTKRPGGPKQGYLHPIEKLPIPFHTVHADCTGPFNASSDRYRYIL